LAVSAGYGAPTASFEKAFERGCNYFYWGSFRKDAMARAIRNIDAKGDRDKLIVVVQVYNRIASMVGPSVERALKKAKLDHADVLLLGWHNKLPSPRMLDAAAQLKDRGRVRFLALSGHNRPAFETIAGRGVFDAFHVRYNAAHRGAEKEVFPRLPAGDTERPGMVIFTATRWGNLPDPKKTPPGEATPRGSDCYRFVMSHPNVDTCMSGPKNAAQMDEALAALDRGPMDAEELAWMRRVGDHIRSQSMRTG